MRVILCILALAPAALANDLVGAVSCRACHAEAYRIWSASPHAHAQERLTPEQQKQPLCLECHSHDEARGGQAEVSGVSCETCHGGGRYYQPAEVMRDQELSNLFGLVTKPSEASCKVCHGGVSPSAGGFDVKAAMVRIDHWTADRAARKKSASAASGAGTRLASWLRH